MIQSTSELTGTYGEMDGLTENERYQLFAAERRRTALAVLGERTAPVDLADLASDVAARENGGDVPDDETVTRVSVVLHHVHLPKMDDLDVVDYDVDGNRVESYSGH